MGLGKHYLRLHLFPDIVCGPLGQLSDMGRLAGDPRFFKGRSSLGPRLSWAWGWSSTARSVAVEAASPVLPSSPPSLASPPTGVFPQCQGPSSFALFMAHVCCLPRRTCERRSSLRLETSLTGVCVSEVFPGLSSYQSDGFGAVVPHGLFL